MPTLPPLFPYLTVSDAPAAIEFYKSAFNATETERHADPRSGRIMNSQLSINGGIVMLADDFSDTMEIASKSPKALGGSPITLHLHFDSGVDEAYGRAVSAGATVLLPLADQFWGDRYGQLLDPFGHRWSLGQPIAKSSANEAQSPTADGVQRDA